MSEGMTVEEAALVEGRIREILSKVVAAIGSAGFDYATATKIVEAESPALEMRSNPYHSGLPALRLKTGQYYYGVVDGGAVHVYGIYGHSSSKQLEDRWMFEALDPVDVP